MDRLPNEKKVKLKLKGGIVINFNEKEVIDLKANEKKVLKKEKVNLKGGMMINLKPNEKKVLNINILYQKKKKSQLKKGGIMINFNEKEVINLKANEKKVLRHIEFRCRLTGWCFEFKQNIAKRLGISTRTVYRCLKTLKEKGLIIVQRRWIQITELGKKVLQFLSKLVKRASALREEIPETLKEEHQKAKRKYYYLMLLKEKILGLLANHKDYFNKNYQKLVRENYWEPIQTILAKIEQEWKHLIVKLGLEKDFLSLKEELVKVLR